MAKFSGPSVIPGASPVLPTEGKVSDFADILATPLPAQETTESPEAQGATITTQPQAPLTGEQPVAAEAAPAQTLTVGVPVPPQVDPTVAAAQREAERIPAFTEKLRRTTLAPSEVNTNQPIESALVRADNTLNVMNARVAGSKITQKKRDLLEQGFPEAAFSSVDQEGYVTVPVAPVLRDSNVNVGVQALLYDPRLLDAGKYNEETGMMGVDPDFARVMSLSAEAWMHQQMESAEEFGGTIDPETALETPRAMDEVGGQRFTKAQGNLRLGREVYTAYKRQRAINEGRPSDDYLKDIDAISPEAFTFIGDLAKEVYAEANPDMVYRDTRAVDEGGQVYFQMTTEGALALEKLNNDFKGLMAQPEVKPLSAPSETAQPVFEGRMRVRPVTTKVGELKDWSQVQTSMKNYHNVEYVNDPGREVLGFMMGMLALINHSNPNNQAYADIFGIGLGKLEELKGEKDRMFAEAARAFDPDQAAELRRQAELYNPGKILQGNREKFLNVAYGAAANSKKVNHITFSMQALTGRTHTQQTLYNPQAHKFIRFVTGGGNTFTFKPRSSHPLDKAWREIIAANLYTTERDGQVYKGSELSTAERYKAFEREFGGAQWNQMVSWGNQLRAAMNNFKIEDAKKAVIDIRNAQSEQDAGAIKKQVVQNFSADPLDASLKSELRKHGDEGLQFAEMFVEIARYDAAVKAGKEFTSRIKAEMDGKTHGPATNAALLGVASMAKRTGMITTQDFSNTDWLDSRKAMGINMEATVASYAGTLFSQNQLPFFTKILENAVADRDNFLKKSPMTMGYGQEIPSLKMHVETTVFSGPHSAAIRKEAKAGGVSLEDTVNFLHTMLVDSIFEIMDPEVVAIGRLMKANAALSVVSNEVLYFDNAMGFRSYAAGKQMQPEETTASSFQIRGEDGKTKKVAVQFYKEKAEGSAERPRVGIGGYTIGRIIPVSVQSYDGNMISKTGSGDSWANITKAAKSFGAKPFVLPVFDAFVVDLGTFAAVREEANKNWMEGIRDHSYIEEVAGTWFNETMELVRAPLENPNQIIDLNEGKYRGIGNLFVRDPSGTSNAAKLFAKVAEAAPKQKGISIDEYTAGLKAMGKKMEKEFFDRLPERSPEGYTAADAQQIILAFVETLNLTNRNRATVKRTSKAKAELLAQVDKTITQVDL